jgi:hypothetical protein
MEALTGKVKDRYYGRLEKIWELDYLGETKIPMFRVRWAKMLEFEDYFTTMVIPPAKPIGKVNVKGINYQNEPWVLAKKVARCFCIIELTRPSCLVTRRGKMSIVGMDEVVNEEDFDQFGDPVKEENDDGKKRTSRRSKTTLPTIGRPFKRRSHKKGLTYNRKKIKRIVEKIVNKWQVLPS